MLGRRRLKNPLIAMFDGGNGHEAVTIPAGTVLDLTGHTFDDDLLMEVVWENRKVLMFTEDLKNTTVPL